MKNPQQNTKKPYSIRIIHRDKVKFIPGIIWFKSVKKKKKKIRVLPDMNRMKAKTHQERVI